jgi:hypothetical protein
MSGPFQKFIIGGSSGEGSKGGGGSPFLSENLLKLCENSRKWDCYYLFLFWNLFFNCLDPSL